MTETTEPLISPLPRSRIWLTLILSLLVVLGFMVPSATAQEAEPGPLSEAERATVFLMQTYDLAGTQALSCVGSGTVISPTGLILTNAHLAGAFGPCRGERIVVALSVRLDEPPVPTYLAEVAEIDTGLDLAVLRIRGSLDGSPIDPDTLNLPSATIGDPSGLLPGNTLTFIGYPNIGAASVAAIEGPITGITSEKGGSRSAWFRTDAELSGTMSGGGAYDASGRLAGILTSAPATNGEEPGPHCLSIQDNTLDGRIDERDECVPIGGEVTAIRPVSFALPLIEAARHGFHLEHAPGLPTVPVIDEPVIDRLFFSTQINDFGMPTRIVSAAPGGTTSLYLFFDYDNMRPGTPYELRVTNNGLDMPLFSLGPLAWGGGRKGTWYIGTENITWPDGNYEFTLFLNGNAVASASIIIGGQPAEPIFSDLTFGIPDGAGGFLTTGKMFPAGTTEIDARFNFEGMVEGQDWTEVWYLDGSQVFSLTRLWDREPNGQATVSAINLEGLPMGTYRLELFIGERLAATGDIILAGNPNSQNQPAVFSNDRIASDITRDGLPGGDMGEVMPLGITSLYAFVDWDFMPNGLMWTYRWFLDGRLVASSTQPWDAGGVGQNFWVSLTADEPLPEGVYAVEVLVENWPMFSKTTTVGSGTRPVSGEEAENDEVMITGTVVDALTGEGIPGAMVIVLDVALESPDFTWNEADILTEAITDREGRFAFPRGLARGNFYTVYVFAEGYVTIVEDNFTIFRDQPSPVDIVIEMSQP